MVLQLKSNSRTRLSNLVRLRDICFIKLQMKSTMKSLRLPRKIISSVACNAWSYKLLRNKRHKSKLGQPLSFFLRYIVTQHFISPIIINQIIGEPYYSIYMFIRIHVKAIPSWAADSKKFDMILMLNARPDICRISSIYMMKNLPRRNEN